MPNSESDRSVEERLENARLLPRVNADLLAMCKSVDKLLRAQHVSNLAQAVICVQEIARANFPVVIALRWAVILVDLLESEAVDVRQAACNALAAVAVAQEGRDAVRSAGGLRALVMLLGEGSRSSVAAAAAAALANCSACDVCKEAITECQGASQLMALLRDTVCRCHPVTTAINTAAAAAHLGATASGHFPASAALAHLNKALNLIPPAPRTSGIHPGGTSTGITAIPSLGTTWGASTTGGGGSGSSNPSTSAGIGYSTSNGAAPNGGSLSSVSSSAVGGLGGLLGGLQPSGNPDLRAPAECRAAVHAAGALMNLCGVPQVQALMLEPASIQVLEAALRLSAPGDAVATRTSFLLSWLAVSAGGGGEGGGGSTTAMMAPGGEVGASPISSSQLRGSHRNNRSSFSAGSTRGPPKSPYGTATATAAAVAGTGSNTPPPTTPTQGGNNRSSRAPPAVPLGGSSFRSGSSGPGAGGLSRMSAPQQSSGSGGVGGQGGDKLGAGAAGGKAAVVAGHA